MKLDNIDRTRELIGKRSTLLDVLVKSEKWSNGHFVFTEHCGDHPDRIAVTYFPELEKKMLDLIREEVKTIEAELAEM